MPQIKHHTRAPDKKRERKNLNIKRLDYVRVKPYYNRQQHRKFQPSQIGREETTSIQKSMSEKNVR